MTHIFSYLRHLTLLSLLTILFGSNMVSASDLDFSDLFGDGNHVHPFINIDATWSDNIYETADDKDSDTVIYTRPGIWFALPGADQQIISIETSTDSPGGATLTRFNDNEMIRYQTYFMYNPEFETYMSNSDHNEINHKAEAYALYNFSGGLSLELLDQYVTNHDDIEKDTDNITYANNYLCGTASYDATEKLRLRMDYSTFNVDYESRANIKDRVDNTLSTYVFFKIRPKTALFFEYTNTDIDYDNASASSTQSEDSRENGYLAGVRWNVTGKTSGTFKAGYQNKAFKDTDIDESIFKMELKGDYEISGHSSLSLTAKNEMSETDEANAYYVDTYSMLTVYEHSITERVTAFMGLYYELEDYGNVDRKDTTIDISPSVSYVYNDRFSLNAAYTYEDVNSSGSDKGEDYSKNSILFSASASW